MARSSSSGPTAACCRTGCPPGPGRSAPTRRCWRRSRSPPAYGWSSAPRRPRSSWTRCARSRRTPASRRDRDCFYDLLVDGELVAQTTQPEGDLVVTDLDDRCGRDPARAGRRRASSGCRSATRSVELWLPWNETTAPGRAAHRRARRAGAAGAPGLAAPRQLDQPGLGRRQPEHDLAGAGRPRGGVDLVNLGLAGSALLDPFTARAMRDTPADLVSLKIGINLVNHDLMRRRAFGPAVHGFLDTIRDGHPTHRCWSSRRCSARSTRRRPDRAPSTSRRSARGSCASAPTGDPADVAGRQAHAPGHPRGAGRDRRAAAFDGPGDPLPGRARAVRRRRPRRSCRCRTTCIPTPTTHRLIGRAVRRRGFRAWQAVRVGVLSQGWHCFSPTSPDSRRFAPQFAPPGNEIAVQIRVPVVTEHDCTAIWRHGRQIAALSGGRPPAAGRALTGPTARRVSPAGRQTHAWTMTLCRPGEFHRPAGELRSKLEPVDRAAVRRPAPP